MVEYRFVRGANCYRVGSDGSVWTRCKKDRRGGAIGDWRPMKAKIDCNGYRRVDLSCQRLGVVRKRHGWSLKISCLVCEAFHGEKPAGAVCRHLNGDRLDDRSDNLAWGTYDDNMSDKRAHGRVLSGNVCPNVKLRDEDVASLMACRGLISASLAAAEFGLSASYVYALWEGRAKRVNFTAKST